MYFWFDIYERFAEDGKVHRVKSLIFGSDRSHAEKGAVVRHANVLKVVFRAKAPERASRVFKEFNQDKPGDGQPLSDEEVKALGLDTAAPIEVPPEDKAASVATSIADYGLDENDIMLDLDGD